jgi:hypothetical protein
MRTTITIDDEILEQLKARAAKEGTTVSQLIEDSVRFAVRPQGETASAEAFELITFGKGGQFTSLGIDRAAALIELEDLERHGRRG